MSSGLLRRSRRLQKKNKMELDDKTRSTTNILSSSVAKYNIAETSTATSPRNNSRKRKRNISSSEDQLRNIAVKQMVKVKDSKHDEKLINRSDVKKSKPKRRFPEKIAGRSGAMQSSSPKKMLNEKDGKCRKPETVPNLSCDGSSSSCSDDEWEDVDEFDFCNSAVPPIASIEVTIKKSKMKIKTMETVETRRACFIKRHVNQKLRQRQINCHKLHRLEELIAGQLYETDKDLATALRQRHLEAVDSLISYYGSRKLTADDYIGWSEKLEETVEKITLFNGGKQDENDSVSIGKLSLKRNYWVEFWEENTRRWICLDPWTGSIDKPEVVEADATSPIHYVLCIDNEYGMRDVTARYASKYLTPAVRRLWVNQNWWSDTLVLYRGRNVMRERLEDISIEQYLFSKPKPTSVPEYKNHPLYVLEKDLSKYETIYPENQQPIGKIKDYNIYLRSSVHRLDGAINWMKKLRSIKPNEKPYRVVQKRSCNRASSEYNGPKTVDLYGRWQTIPYVTPKIVDGRVPRNEFGNLYVYKNSMLPDGCVHLKLNGLLAIARKLGIDCVPAVVGWNHCRGSTHPILDGCIILKEHEKELREAWSKHYEKKELTAKLKRTQRAIENWRSFVKGLLTLKKVRARFASKDRRVLHVDEKLNAENATITTNDAEAVAWPPTVYSLPDLNSKS